MLTVPAGAVDAHHHVWDLAAHAQPWLDDPDLAPINRTFDLAELIPEAAAVGVTRTVIVETDNIPGETEALLALAARAPLVAGVVGWVDLTAPGIADELDRLRERPDGAWLRGMRHQVQGEADPRWLERVDVQRGLRAVAAAGLCFDLLTRPSQLRAAIAAVRAVPELTFVLDHCSKPDVRAGVSVSWATAVRALASAPNVACKLSGLVTEADWQRWCVDDLRPVADVVLEAFGPERVMFGSDWPVCLLAANYQEVVDTARQLTATLSPSERERVFAGTATEVYRLA
jgi:L-fuconolactonase